MKTFIMAAVAMLAFAANSVIARLALSEHGIDPGSFTLLRLIAGAIVLAIIVSLSPRGKLHEVKSEIGNYRIRQQGYEVGISR